MRVVMRVRSLIQNGELTTKTTVRTRQCAVQFSTHSATNECKVLGSFISIFMYGADSLFVSAFLLDQSLRKSSNFFSKAIKDVQITVLQCHVLNIYFLQRKP